MKRIKFMVVGVLLLTVVGFAMVGCASSHSNGDMQLAYPAETGDYYDNSKTTDSGTSGDAGETAPERKIIYSAEVSISVEDVSAKKTQCDALLNSDEWCEDFSAWEGYCTITYRIKTDRLDAFIAAISEKGEVTSVSKESRDVSVNYYDNSAQKDILLREQARLSELLSEATSISDILAINTRLSQIETQLKQINGTLKQYDSLVDYSKIIVNLSTPKYVKEQGFGSRLGEAFSTGWNVAQSIFIFLLVLIPFAVVIGGITIGIVFGVKRAKAKKSLRAVSAGATALPDSYTKTSAGSQQATSGEAYGEAVREESSATVNQTDSGDKNGNM